MNIFEENDYKKVLNNLIKEKRKTQKGFSSKLAEHLGVHATLVSQVFAGSKDFTEEQMLLVCEFMGIPKLESQYLLVLLQFERAGSKKLKDYFLELKKQIQNQALQVSKRVTKDKHLTEVEKSIFYSSWIYSAIHLLTTLETDVHFEFICKKLNLSQSKARAVLDFLIETKMVVEENGKFKPGAVATHLEKSSPFLIKHHTNWRLQAIQAAETLSDEELMYTGNISISRKDFAILREELMQTIQRVLKVVGPSPAEDLAQFNLDFFWLKK